VVIQSGCVQYYHMWSVSMSKTENLQGLEDYGSAYNLLRSWLLSLWAIIVSCWNQVERNREEKCFGVVVGWAFSSTD
jgi:hypothetical protein